MPVVGTLALKEPSRRPFARLCLSHQAGAGCSSDERRPHRTLQIDRQVIPLARSSCRNPASHAMLRGERLPRPATRIGRMHHIHQRHRRRCGARSGVALNNGAHVARSPSPDDTPAIARAARPPQASRAAHPPSRPAAPPAHAACSLPDYRGAQLLILSRTPLRRRCSSASSAVSGSRSRTVSTAANSGAVSSKARTLHLRQPRQVFLCRQKTLAPSFTASAHSIVNPHP